jgi:hypothetical protein
MFDPTAGWSKFSIRAVKHAQNGTIRFAQDHSPCADSAKGEFYGFNGSLGFVFIPEEFFLILSFHCPYLRGSPNYCERVQHLRPVLVCITFQDITSGIDS